MIAVGASWWRSYARLRPLSFCGGEAGTADLDVTQPLPYIDDIIFCGHTGIDNLHTQHTQAGHRYLRQQAVGVAIGEASGLLPQGPKYETMRLINVHTLKLESFIDEESAPKYAILSHTWGSKEIQYLDLVNYRPGEDDERLDWRKIHLTCEQAKKDELDYAWVDTCCIDKSSSTELSEAINSMFKWYQKSAVCYVFMPDVQIHDRPGEPQEDQISASRLSSQDLNEQAEAASTAGSDADHEPEDSSSSSETRFLSSFRASRWWTRGWTLQELLAPERLVFYDVHWDLIGEKPPLVNPSGSHPDLMADITSITNISSKVLTHDVPLSDIGIAVRMSWASTRTTTRKEDIAYCLLGIFDINMPLLYGEGAKAFRRLQEEIVRTSTDQSIFAWNGRDCSDILAPAPANFAQSSTVVPRKRTGADFEAYQLNHKGLSITLPVLFKADFQMGQMCFPGFRYAILDCANLEMPGHYVCLQLDQVVRGNSVFSGGLECSFIHEIIYIRESLRPGFVDTRDVRTTEMIVRPLSFLESFYGGPGPHSGLPVQLLLPSDDKAAVDLQPLFMWNNETTFLDPTENEQTRTIHIMCRNRAGGATLTLWLLDALLGPPFGFRLEHCPRSSYNMENDEEHGRNIDETRSFGEYLHLSDLPEKGLYRHVLLSWRSAVVVSFIKGPVGEHSDGLRIQLEVENGWKWARWRLGVILGVIATKIKSAASGSLRYLRGCLPREGS